jgi:hypothetical protein
MTERGEDGLKYHHPHPIAMVDDLAMRFASVEIRRPGSCTTHGSQ